MQDNIELSVGIFVFTALTIFIYMGFYVGTFRFDSMRYNKYSVIADDATGIFFKTEIKIAGVTVGRVQQICLNNDNQVIIEFSVFKQYTLFANAHAVVRQENLLSARYIELHPGTQNTALLQPPAVLHEKCMNQLQMDTLLISCEKIAEQVQEVTKTMADVFGSQQGKKLLEKNMQNIQKTTKQIAQLTTVMQSLINSHQQDLKTFMTLGPRVHALISALEQDAIPAFTNVAEQMEYTGKEINQSVGHVNALVRRVEQGRGLLGKIVRALI